MHFWLETNWFCEEYAGLIEGFMEGPSHCVHKYLFGDSLY